jgi:hypothetical protein
MTSDPSGILSWPRSAEEITSTLLVVEAIKTTYPSRPPEPVTRAGMT